MKLKNIHCCKFISDFILDPRVPIIYDPKVREYNMLLIRNKFAVQGIIYCPWCGTKLPKSLRDEYYFILENEYNIDPYKDYAVKSPYFPEEFKSDEWWKKRKL